MIWFSPKARKKPPEISKTERQAPSAKVGLNPLHCRHTRNSNDKAIHQCERRLSLLGVGVIRIGDLVALHKNDTGRIHFVQVGALTGSEMLRKPECDATLAPIAPGRVRCEPVADGQPPAGADRDEHRGQRDACDRADAKAL